jgi:CRP-like cAMP-binding protein
MGLEGQLLVDLGEALRFNYLFRGLTPAQVQAVVDIARETTFDGGQVIVRQFDKNSDLMIILAGGALIKAFSGETLAEVGPGSVIGEISLIDDQPRSATVVASERTAVACLPSLALHNLMDHDPSLKSQLLMNIGRVLCQRLRTVNIQLDALLAKEGQPQTI